MVFFKLIKIVILYGTFWDFFCEKVVFFILNTKLEKLFENFESDEREEGRKKERMNERMKE